MNILVLGTFQILLIVLGSLLVLLFPLLALISVLKNNFSGNDKIIWVLVRGKHAPESVIRGMLQSFIDAPGVLREDGSYSVTAEEVHEISFALGAEYWYKKLLAFRTGYFHEHASKGNRNFYTFGLGTRYRFISLDLSYLLPAVGRNSPLYNTFKLSLTLTP